jgi:signal transduction histidine kinase
MEDRPRPELCRILIAPLVTIGALGALLVWEVEHIASLPIALEVAAAALIVAVVVTLYLRARIAELSDYYEALLKNAEEQSRRAETANRTKGDFLATLSHELRTPLNSVLGWARLLASGKLDKAQATRAVASIERAGWAQSRVIEDLLDISRIADGKLQLAPRPTVLHQTVDAAIASLTPAADAKRISIDVAVNPQIGPITIDPDRLQQIVWHLVSNSIKFTPPGGRVNVRVEPEGGVIKLTVEDTGIGFPSDDSTQLFEFFRQGDSGTTRQYGGLGIGLGIVRHLVEMQGGTITARSSGRNKGSTFEVTLPMHPAESYVSDLAPLPETAPLLRGVSVLVVDDNAQDRDFIRSSLEHFGAVVETAASAPEARRHFERNRPDVILSDLRMPGEDGFQFIQQIRSGERSGCLTPAAALTALVRADDRRKALRAGFQMHVAKPIDPFELASTVEHLAHLEKSA